MSTKSRARLSGVAGSWALKSAPGARGKPPKRPIGKLIERRPKLGQSAWWATAGRQTIADYRAVPQRWTGLARGRVQSLQDPGKPDAERHPPAARYADLEA